MHTSAQVSVTFKTSCILVAVCLISTSIFLRLIRDCSTDAQLQRPGWYWPHRCQIVIWVPCAIWPNVDVRVQYPLDGNTARIWVNIKSHLSPSPSCFLSLRLSSYKTGSSFDITNCVDLIPACMQHLLADRAQKLASLAIASLQPFDEEVLCNILLKGSDQSRGLRAVCHQHLEFTDRDENTQNYAANQFAYFFVMYYKKGKTIWVRILQSLLSLKEAFNLQ